jgi:outer membrane protein
MATHPCPTPIAMRSIYSPRVFLYVLMSGLVLTALSAHAQSPDTPWSARVGFAEARFDTRADLSLAGSPVAGGEVGAPDKQLMFGDISYAIDERWSARLAIAAPPTVAMKTGGSLQAFVPPLSGTLGEVKLAPLIFTLCYSPLPVGPVRPYLGVGAHYLKILASHDADIAGLKISNTQGGVLQAGVDIELTPRWSLYWDVRRLYAKSTARGTVPALGNLPVNADITLDPTISSIGLAYRF